MGRGGNERPLLPPSLPPSLPTLTFTPVLRVSQTIVKPFTPSGISDKAFSTCYRTREGGQEGGSQGELEEGRFAWYTSSSLVGQARRQLGRESKEKGREGG